MPDTTGRSSAAHRAAHTRWSAPSSRPLLSVHGPPVPHALLRGAQARPASSPRPHSFGPQCPGGRSRHSGRHRAGRAGQGLASKSRRGQVAKTGCELADAVAGSAGARRPPTPLSRHRHPGRRARPDRLQRPRGAGRSGRRDARRPPAPGPTCRHRSGPGGVDDRHGSGRTRTTYRAKARARTRFPGRWPTGQDARLRSSGPCGTTSSCTRVRSPPLTPPSSRKRWGDGVDTAGRTPDLLGERHRHRPGPPRPGRRVRLPPPPPSAPPLAAPRPPWGRSAPPSASSKLSVLGGRRASHCGSRRTYRPPYGSTPSPRSRCSASRATCTST